MSEAKRCPNCGCVLSLASERSQYDDSAAESAPISDLEARLKPLDPAQPDVPPIPLLATGSSDDSFVRVPESQRLMAAGARPDPRSNFDPPWTVSRIETDAAELLAKSQAKLDDQLSSHRHRRTQDIRPRIRIGLEGQWRLVRQDDRRTSPRSVDSRGSTILLLSYASAHDPGPRLDGHDGPFSSEIGGHARRARTSRHRRSQSRSPGRPVEESRAARADPRRAFRHLRATAQGRLPGDHADRRQARETSSSNAANAYASPLVRRAARTPGPSPQAPEHIRATRSTRRSTRVSSRPGQGDRRYLRRDRRPSARLSLPARRSNSEWSIVGQDFTELKPGESQDRDDRHGPRCPSRLRRPVHLASPAQDGDQPVRRDRSLMAREVVDPPKRSEQWQCCVSVSWLVDVDAFLPASCLYSLH